MEPLDRRNRIRWALVGLVLLGVRGGGLLAGAGVFGQTVEHEPLLAEWVVRRWHDGYPWDLVLAGVLGLPLAWYGWALLRTQLWPGDGRRPMGDYEYRPGGRWRPSSLRGRTIERLAATTGIPPRTADVTIRLIERKRPRVT